MKTTTITTLILSLAFIACKNDKQAETSTAKQVDVVQGATTTTYATIAEGSQLKWRATHLGGVQPRFGTVKIKEATVLVNKKEVTNATFIVDIATLTVDSFEKGAEQKGELEAHLKNKDFFNVTQYPTVKFEVTKITPSTGTYNSEVMGNLTILGITKNITFKANIAVQPDAVAINSEDFTLNRQDWGLNFHSEGDTGIPKDYLISDDLGFTINVKVKK